MERAPPAPVIWPKFTLLMSVLGSFHRGVLARLKASPRSWSLKRSPISKLRKMEASSCQAPGPLPAFLLRLPNSGTLLTGFCSAPGCAKHCVATIAPLLGSKLHFVGVNQFTPRPVLCVTWIGPGPNQFRVLALPGVLSWLVSPPKLMGC